MRSRPVRPASYLVIMGRTESRPNPRRCPDCGGWVWAVAGRVFPDVCPRCMAEFRGGVATPILDGGRRRSRLRRWLDNRRSGEESHMRRAA